MQNRENVKKQVPYTDTKTRTAVVCGKCGAEKVLYKPPRIPTAKAEVGDFSELDKPGVTVTDIHIERRD